MTNYNNKFLKYKFDNEELKLIDKTWDFLRLFHKKFVFVSDTRKHMIKVIRKKYTINEFFKLETIANKLLWNLRWIIFPFWKDPKITKDTYYEIISKDYNGVNELPKYLTLCNSIKYKNKDDLKKKINMLKIKFAGHYYRSFINKMIIVDKNNNMIYFKPIEGSSSIFEKNYFNLFSSQLMMDRNLYEMVMKNPFIVKKLNIKMAEYYQQFDYPFPNLNFCKYMIGNDNDRLNRIKKMYYYDDPKEKYWFKLIY